MAKEVQHKLLVPLVEWSRAFSLAGILLLELSRERGECERLSLGSLRVRSTRPLTAFGKSFGNSLEVSRSATCKWIPHSCEHTCVSCRVFNRSVAMSASFVGDNNSNHVDRSTPLVPESPLSFPDICARIHDRISTFLTEETNEQNLRSVQEQTRISLGVISEALDRYRYI